MVLNTWIYPFIKFPVWKFIFHHICEFIVLIGVSSMHIKIIYNKCQLIINVQIDICYQTHRRRRPYCIVNFENEVEFVVLKEFYFELVFF
jgi:hypothetical protein